MAFKDLMMLKEFNECKSFVESISNNIQQDELDRLSNKKK